MPSKDKSIETESRYMVAWRREWGITINGYKVSLGVMEMFSGNDRTSL